MGFPKQEYWSQLPFSPPGDLPDLEIEPVSPVLAGNPVNHQGSDRVGPKVRFYDLRSPVEFQNSFEKADIT